MKICMLGAGAMGRSIGGMLAAHGEEVVFVDTWKEHVDAMSMEENRRFPGPTDICVKRYEDLVVSRRTRENGGVICAKNPEKVSFEPTC